MESSFFNQVFPSAITDYFEITQYYQLCSIEDKLEYWLIDFDERNDIGSRIISGDNLYLKKNIRLWKSAY